MSEYKEKILIVTAKWPFESNSTDGGDATLKEILKAVQGEFTVDLFCFRNDQGKANTMEGVRQVMIYQDDFAVFKNYAKHDKEKFRIRLRQAKVAAKQIKKIGDNYDLIVVQHMMFLLEMGKEAELLRSKVVLYPMFTGTSYVMSGEKVPSRYMKKEKTVLRKVGLIITPSDLEKEKLITQYNVSPSHIKVIPRTVRFSYSSRVCKPREKVHLVYIAAVRLQKNHLLAMRLVRELLRKKINVVLNCIGAIQDTKIYEECNDYIKKNNMEGHVVFHGNKPFMEVEKIVAQCDINISVSNWETFGRGIYEGMVVGLPTIILEKLECIKMATCIGIYPCIVKDIFDMAKTIERLICDNEFYQLESVKGERLQVVLDENRIYQMVCKSYKEFIDNGKI